MESYKTITANFLNYNPEELMEIERYVCFDNIAEGSMQALLNNDIKEKIDNVTLTYQDSENPDDNMPVDTSSKEAFDFANDSAIDENQVLLEENNEDNDSEVIDDKTISLKNRGETSSRGSYKCGQCGDVGHNAAYHKRKGRERGSN
ncbi:5206_t:CDS:2 [Gigaspora margarita]|uniref:5206_t:CDS:1 n=1 Tax=Gigaspora margarita TaxID=4874 RepID=A0ABN7V7V3_GIGMA|nr:5206_t:CDS:2 [Gigaspora margarita]